MVVDYDFTLGKQRLRGVGWRGLVALGITLVFRTEAFAIMVISAKTVEAPAAAADREIIWRLSRQ